MRKNLKKYFLTGLLLVIPLYITFYVLKLLVFGMDGLLVYLPKELNPDTYLPFHIPGLGLLITVIGIFLIGVVATNFFGRKLIQLGEWLLDKIPVLRGIYKAVKQILETFFSSEESFTQVVMVEYPRLNVYSIGFVTGTATGEFQVKTKKELINVFVPTTPNPTSGFFIAFPKEELVFLDMSVEDGFKLLMSAGMVAPPYPAPKENNEDKK